MRRIKGMSLVELLVAIAVLGISSTMLAVAMAQVSAINRDNAQFNLRMQQQVGIAENMDNDSTVSITSQQFVFDVTFPSGYTASGKYSINGSSHWIKGVEDSEDSSKTENDRVELNFKYFESSDPKDEGT